MTLRHRSEPMTGQEVRDDEREALERVLFDGLHRGLTVHEIVTTVFAAGYRKHPEPEWEYGLYEEDPHRERERPHRAYNGAHLVSDNRAHVEGQWRKGHPSIKYVKRQKAGPWVPVGEGEQ